MLEAILLGVVQGLTEFLPVSSDGHLILARSAFGISDQGLGFDVILHLGTLLAVIFVFRRDLLRLGSAGLAAYRERSIGDCPDRKLGLMLIVATIPGVIAGATFEHLVSGPLREPQYTGIFLLATGGLLLLAENAPQPQPRLIQERNYAHALLIGTIQATAILPGLSRSGAAFAGGRMLGLSRPDAVRFSFLLAVPIVGGAIVYEAAQGLSSFRLADVDYTYFVGAFCAAVVGFLAVTFLISFVQRFSLLPFAAYCIILGASTIFLTSGKADDVALALNLF